MILYRVFSWNGSSRRGEAGGPLYVPRSRQGSGRHDNPELYGAVYCALEPVGCIAEALQPFRNQAVGPGDLERHPGMALALVELELSADVRLCNLDEPGELQRRSLRPSRIATLDRRLTQELAAHLFHEGLGGCLWWSVLESLWINATLFAERISGALAIRSGPRRLALADPDVGAAARRLGIRLTGAET
jgi:hypothetical protein